MLRYFCGVLVATVVILLFIQLCALGMATRPKYCSYGLKKLPLDGKNDPRKHNYFHDISVFSDSGDIAVSDYRERVIYLLHDDVTDRITIGGEPWAVVVDSKDQIFVGIDNRIILMERKGKVLNNTWGSATFTDLQGMAMDKDDYLYAVDGATGRVKKFDPNGNFIEFIHKRNDRRNVGPFYSKPHFIAVSSKGTVGITDSDGNIYLFNRIGVITKTIPAKQPDSFNTARGIQIDDEDIIIVADINDPGCIAILLEDGTVPCCIGKGHLVEPHGVKLTPEGDILVTEIDAKRVGKWSSELTEIDDKDEL